MKRPLRAEMLAIGDELLDGRVVDTNSIRLAHALAPVGVTIAQRTVVTDDIEAIVAAGRDIIARGSQLCVISGGLGPTADDVTAAAMATLAKVPLVRDEACAATITERLKARGREVGANHLRQADRPQSATVLDNPVGTAPGFAIEISGCRFVSVPGVPKEFDALVAANVVAPLVEGAEARVQKTMMLFGLPEADVDRLLAPLAQRWPQLRVQFRVKFPEVHVTLHGPRSEAEALQEAIGFSREVLGDRIYAEDDGSFAGTVLKLLRQHKATVALAESCTGGLITDLLTDEPGSSDVVHAGITAYANAAKKKFLGVSEEALSQYGSVSRQVVMEMASGARSLVPSTYGLAVSGIAGPGGGSANKPVGTLWFGLATPRGVEAEHLLLPFGRRENKIMAAYHGLDLLRRHVLAEANPC